MQATMVSLCTSRPAQCGYKSSIAAPYAPLAWNPNQWNLTSVLQGRKKQPVATIRGAQGFRVQLENGLMRTKDRTTSVPPARKQCTTDLTPVSSPVGRKHR